MITFQRQVSNRIKNACDPWAHVERAEDLHQVIDGFSRSEFLQMTI
jgi:hypothetical protein